MRHRFTQGDLFTRIADLAFEHVDADHSGSISKEEFLRSYLDMFCNERKQMALLLRKDFPGVLRFSCNRIIMITSCRTHVAATREGARDAREVGQEWRSNHWIA